MFTRAWRLRDAYDPARPLGGWLTGITRRVIADVFQARRRDAELARASIDAASAESRTPPQPVESLVAQLVVREAIDTLGSPQDEVLRLVYLQDLPLKDAAQRLNLPVGTVKSHVHRGLARLRIALEVHDVAVA